MKKEDDEAFKLQHSIYGLVQPARQFFLKITRCTN